tara:strand:+ start:206 stop:673 length:468 start_codon:yes stop_codon:yes gene_type:complete
MVKPQPIENPVYTLPQIKKRLIIPKIITFLFLGIIFYVGVLLNVSLLSLSGATKTLTLTIALIVLIGLIIFGIVFNILQAKKIYKFYGDRIVFGKKQIPFNAILNTEIKRNFLDKIFKTYSLLLSKQFTISNISENIQLQNYIEQLITYTKNKPN